MLFARKVRQSSFGGATGIEINRERAPEGKPQALIRLLPFPKTPTMAEIAIETVCSAASFQAIWDAGFSEVAVEVGEGFPDEDGICSQEPFDELARNVPVLLDQMGKHVCVLPPADFSTKPYGLAFYAGELDGTQLALKHDLLIAVKTQNAATMICMMGGSALGRAFFGKIKTEPMMRLCLRAEFLRFSFGKSGVSIEPETLAELERAVDGTCVGRVLCRHTRPGETDSGYAKTAKDISAILEIWKAVLEGAARSDVEQAARAALGMDTGESLPEDGAFLDAEGFYRFLDEIGFQYGADILASAHFDDGVPLEHVCAALDHLDPAVRRIEALDHLLENA